tara:strand:- start:63 stop:659 length:597 start_codon:yes stop_codon:yes gene_type:complete
MWQSKDEKTFILDPLTCIIRLGMLSFKPMGTKISIYQNKISYNDPNLLQGTIRWGYGDNRNDLHNLFKPILLSTQWYNDDDKMIKNIFKYAIEGLKNLKKAYNINSIICHSIDHYINILNDVSINEKKNSKEDENDLYKQLKELWNKSEISIINSLLNETEKQKNQEHQKSYLNSIENILKLKEERVIELIIKNTTLL